MALSSRKETWDKLALDTAFLTNRSGRASESLGNSASDALGDEYDRAVAVS